MGGPLGAAVAWARADVAARWRALLALGLIVGVTAGLALGCLVGAQRTGTALDRLEERTGASDAIVFASQAGVFDPDWEALAAHPEVEELAPWALVFGDIEIDDAPDELMFVPVGEQWMETIDEPIVVEGRMWDPTSDHEVLLGEQYAREAGIDVGFTTRFQPFVEADYGEGFERLDAPPKGPLIEMRVVGLIRTPLEPLFVPDGLALLSPGLLRRHPEVVSLQNAAVRLRDDTSEAQTALARHTSEEIAPGVPILDLEAIARRVTTTTDVERTALLLLAAVIALAGLTLAGQVVGRSAATIVTDAATLQAIGLPRRAVGLAATVAHLPAAAVAAAALVATSVAMSSVLPFGLADDLDPDTGLRLDVLATVAGAVVVLALVLGATFANAWRAAGQRDVAPAEDPRGLVGWLRGHSSVVVGLGTTMALRRLRGRRGVPVRPALLGAVVGVLGVAGALTVDAGLEDALDHPERAGVVWDLTVLEGDPSLDAVAPGFTDESIAAVRRAEHVAAVWSGQRVATSVGGVGAPVFVFEPVADEPPLELTVVDGRAPRRAGEAAIGPHTASRLGVGIGDEVEVGSGGEVTIVGSALFPTDVHAGFDEGVWLTPGDLDLVPEVAENSFEGFLAVRLEEGADVEEAMAGLAELTAPIGAHVFPPELPPELLNLRDVIPLPRWVGAFLAVLAVAALLHVLSSTARARAHDFAVLRAIGVTRRGTRLVLNVQSLSVFLAGLVLGIPLGIAAGRQGWSLIADRVPLRDVRPLAGLALALLVPVALLVSQAVALGPGRRLRRLRPAEVLRTE